LGDGAWVKIFGGGKQGRFSMMDAVGLDTIEFIEEHYIEEMGSRGKNAVDFLKKDMIQESWLQIVGKVDSRLLDTTKSAGEDNDHHENLHAPFL
jgi:3-hydroxyacyl-CoA dehydrogenase